MKKIDKGSSPIHLFQTKNPKNVTALKRMGFELELLGIGVYRKVYRIVGTDYVVKFPLGLDGIAHAANEYAAFSEIKESRKYRRLWKYMPDIFYYHADNGVTLMPYYRPIDVGTKKARELGTALSCVMADLFRFIWHENFGGSIDVHDGNIGLTKDGEPVMIDMGYFYGPTEDVSDGQERKGS